MTDLTAAHRAVLDELNRETPGTARHDLLTLVESYLAEYLYLRRDADAREDRGPDVTAE